MQKISSNELKQIKGGGGGTVLIIIAGIIFLIGVIDGYKPQSLNKFYFFKI